MQEAKHELFYSTPQGYPPECYPPSKGYNGPLLDAWLLGSVLLKLVNPTYYRFRPELIDLNNEIRFDLNTFDTLSYELEELIRALLNNDEKQRMQVEDICNHKWFLINL